VPFIEADLFSMNRIFSAARFLPMSVIALRKVTSTGVVVFCRDCCGQELLPAKCYRLKNDESGPFGFTSGFGIGRTPILQVIMDCEL